MSFSISSPVSFFLHTPIHDQDRLSSTKQLVDAYYGKTRTPGSTPKIIGFTHETFKKIADTYTQIYEPRCDYAIHAGWIEKQDLPQASELFVRADIHGDLPTLISHLRTAVEEGILDKNYRVNPPYRLIFLGDYTDRGSHSLEVLALLMCLKIENNEQVILIRGNHEDIEGNIGYEHPKDHGFESFLWGERNGQLYVNRDNLSLLEKIYRTLPLAVYISHAGEKRHYTLFTHGLFEPYLDPLPLLEASDAQVYLPIGIERTLSHPIQALLERNNLEELTSQYDRSDPQEKKTLSKQILSLLCARRIQQLYMSDSQMNTNKAPYSSIYQWGDIGVETRLDSFQERSWHLTPLDIQCILYLHQSKTVKVKHVVRGHQHEFRLHTTEASPPLMKKANKVFITTLPVAMGNRAYTKRFPNQKDRVHLYTIAPRIYQWTKIAYTRGYSEKFPTKSGKQFLEEGTC